MKLSTIKAVRPNLGIQAAYQKRLTKLITEMHHNVMFWIQKTYADHEDNIALDEAPTAALQKAFTKLAREWLTRFDAGAKELAAYFSRAVSARSDRDLARILKRSGFSIGKFRMTKAQQRILAATIAQNVDLIKSIPRQYLSQVQGEVMRSVQLGGDLQYLSKKLQTQYGVTKRRAALIARDQNAKATAAMNRSRQIELGITEAVWVHSGGGKEPRPTHVKAGQRRTKFDVAKGWWDPDAHGKGKGAFIQPGELINCRCVSRSILPGFANG